MNALSEIQPGNVVPSNPNANSMDVLSSEDFLQLLITQITTQDPLEPVGNQELLNQISSIRDIELSTSLTDTIKSLTGQQYFAAGSALIGQFVASVPDEAGNTISGVVEGVRFDKEGKAVLQLSGGGEFPLENVQSIESPMQAAEALVGATVVGMSAVEGRAPELVEGIVTSVSEESDQIMLELDTGAMLAFQRILRVVPSQE